MHGRGSKPGRNENVGRSIEIESICEDCSLRLYYSTSFYFNKKY
jgi:hypothetical protein